MFAPLLWFYEMLKPLLIRSRRARCVSNTETSVFIAHTTLQLLHLRVQNGATVENHTMSHPADKAHAFAFSYTLVHDSLPETPQTTSDNAGPSCQRFRSLHSLRPKYQLALACLSYPISFRGS